MKLLKLTTMMAALILSTSVSANLVGRLAATPGGTDYQAYYDDVANLTWLADANAVGGYVNWDNANSWAATLVVDGVSGWRLPTTLQPDSSCDNNNNGVSNTYNCSGSELGNLFYNVLGNTAYAASDAGPFSNIVQYGRYWSATEYAPNINYAWYFVMEFYGYQDYIYKGYSEYYTAWAVQTGDVSAVPVPAAVWLFGSGLLGLIGLAKRKRFNRL